MNASQRPTRVAEPLSGLLARVDPEGKMRAFRVWDIWSEVVGPAIAERAEPERLRESVLIVQVSSHTWMQEIQFLKEDIRSRLNHRLGGELISDLHFVLGRKQRSRAAKSPAAVLAPVVVPELPSTGSPALDEVLQRIATAAARRRAELEPRKRSRGSRRR